MLSAVLPYNPRQCHWPFYKSLYTLKTEILYTVKVKLFGQLLTAVILKQCFGSDQKYDFISFCISTRNHITVWLMWRRGGSKRARSSFSCSTSRAQTAIWNDKGISFIQGIGCVVGGPWTSVWREVKVIVLLHIYYQRSCPEPQDQCMRQHFDFLLFSEKN